jgi:hypothetical protein
LSPAPPRRALLLGVCASLAAHLAGLMVVRLRAAPEPTARSDAFLMVDVDLAPPPPDAFDPPDETSPTAVEPSHAADDVAPPEPPPEPPDDGVASDAGPSDAGPVDGDAGPADAGPADAGPADAAATGDDAGPLPLARAGDAGAGAPVDRDAGPRIAGTGTGAARDAGSRLAAAAQDGGAGTAATGVSTGTGPGTTATASTAPPGAAADFGPYIPTGDTIGVLIRFDRLRGTAWAARADAILAPMPDYRSIIGNRKRLIADQFDSLLISSSDPTDVTATNLAARGLVPAAELRRFLDHAGQPVRWTAARGGALGSRGRSPFKLDGDSRVYLQPFPSWVVLTAAGNLGHLIDPSDVSLDAAHADPADLPEWLARVQTVDVESGADHGPILVASVSQLPRVLRLPRFGELPGPEHLSVAFDLATTGFEVRGTLRFADARTAKRFETDLLAGRDRVLDSALGQAMLRSVHGYNALKGLSLKRRDRQVTFATSLSGADGKAMMELAAEWSRRFFDSQRPPTRTTP